MIQVQVQASTRLIVTEAHAGLSDATLAIHTHVITFNEGISMKINKPPKQKDSTLYIYSTKQITEHIPCGLVQVVFGVSPHPAVAFNPRGPINLDLLRDGTKPLL